MKFFPSFWPDEWAWSAQRKADNNANTGGGIAASLRDSQGMGPWQGVLGAWQPRARSPYLLEALREALPILDGGIARMSTMDGIIEVQGANDKLVQEIDEWMRNVPFNDLETGYQAFYASQNDEHYEQGVGVGEFSYDKRGREVIGLRVADSKGICFIRENGVLQTWYRAPDPERDNRPDGLGTVERLLRGDVRGDVASGLHSIGYVQLDPRQLVYALHKPEADNPYGTSILRSMPFVAQILLKMENASGRTWERFGDPPFHVHYGTKNRKISADDALKRAKSIAKDLATALSGKARGNSVDLVTAAAADDDVTLKVIGAEGEALEIEQPARHMLEQIVAGFGLPPWMLGITWQQAAGIGEQQSVVVLQEAQTRFEKRKPQLRRPIEAMLRARGRTWKPQDWDLVQRLPNLMDEQKRAQAGFLRAQTAMMLGERGQIEPPEPGTGIDNNLRAPRGPRRAKAGRKADDEESDPAGEPWAESDPELPRIEADATAAMLAQWQALETDVLGALGLTQPDGEAFQHTADMIVAVLSLGEVRLHRIANALLDAQLAAWDRGIENAADDIPPALTANGPKSAERKQARKLLHRAWASGTKAEWLTDPIVSAAILALRLRIRDEFARTGLALVREGVARTLRDKIVTALASGEFDGQNPLNVARELERRFDAGDYNWERLARSEIAMAQSDGKLDLYRQQGVTVVDYETAGDSRVSRICNELAEAGPYAIDKAPVPVRDSHPGCRCTLLARE